MFHEQKFDDKVIQKLGLRNTKTDLSEWKSFVKKLHAEKKSEITIAITAEKTLATEELVNTSQQGTMN